MLVSANSIEKAPKQNTLSWFFFFFNASVEGAKGIFKNSVVTNKQ